MKECLMLEDGGSEDREIHSGDKYLLVTLDGFYLVTRNLGGEEGFVFARFSDFDARDDGLLYLYPMTVRGTKSTPQFLRRVYANLTEVDAVLREKNRTAFKVLEDKAHSFLETVRQIPKGAPWTVKDKALVDFIEYEL